MYKYYKYISLIALSLIVSCSEDPIENLDTGILTGIVVSEGNNTPVENVRISTNPPTSTVFTDENGEFVIEDVAIDQYSVQAELEGFLTGFEGATVTAGSTTNVVIDLRTDDSDNRPPTAPLLITPSDNDTDIPLEVELVWSSSDPDDDEISYSVELRNNIDNEIIAFTELTDTTQVVSNLRFGLRYFWQVTASDNINEPVLSEISSFETILSPNNRFLFVREENGNNIIFSSDEEGNELQLTEATSNSFRPRRNNTANRVAFLSNSGAQTHIFTMNLDGSNVEQVTSAVPVNGFNLDELDFSWTANGDRLVYSNFDRLYSINVNGTGLQQIYQTTDGSFITEAVISADESLIVLKTNDVNGYNVSIFTIDSSGTIINNVFSGMPGAAGGLDISVNNAKIVYWYDVSGFESPNYRQLDSRIFLYEIASDSAIEISDDKVVGTNDFDCKFSPNEAEVIITNTSNDGLSQRNVLLIDTDNSTVNSNRTLLFSNAEMPDFE